jgi:AcrR family transcriptional regulator
VNPRAHVLDVAARLFTEQGFAATSTREIAEAVGIRQASLYYHFPDGKQTVLTEVLAQTIRPTLDIMDAVEDATDDPAVALYLLVLLDVRTLAEAPHNSGLLGMLPDVAELAADFQAARKELLDAYDRFGARVASAVVMESAAGRLGHLLLGNVETAIGWIRDGSFGPTSADVIAASCLRICGAGEDAIAFARVTAHELLPGVADESV